MRKQRSGLVISISSTAGVVSNPFGSIYAASKFALEGWMEGMAGEVEPYGIRTMIVEPGFFRTELLQPESTTFGELSIDDYAERTAQTIPAWQAMNGQQAGDPAKLAGRRRGRRRGRRAEGPAAARAGGRAPRAVDQPRPRRRPGSGLTGTRPMKITNARRPSCVEQ
jgi:NAD(P)-dependent dehydrogenase (short-subunit alcohol dehydrogenase family)